MRPLVDVGRQVLLVSQDAGVGMIVGDSPDLSTEEIRQLRVARQRVLFERWQRLHAQKNSTASVVLRDTLSEKMRELEDEMEKLQ